MRITINLVRSMLTVTNEAESVHPAAGGLRLRRVGNAWAILDGTDVLSEAAEKGRIRAVGTPRELFMYLSGRQDMRIVSASDD